MKRLQYVLGSTPDKGIHMTFLELARRLFLLPSSADRFVCYQTGAHKILFPDDPKSSSVVGAHGFLAGTAMMNSAFPFSTFVSLQITDRHSCSVKHSPSLISNRKNPCIMGKQYMEATVVDVRLKKVPHHICTELEPVKGQTFPECWTATSRSCIE